MTQEQQPQSIDVFTPFQAVRFGQLARTTTLLDGFNFVERGRNIFARTKFTNAEGKEDTVDVTRQFLRGVRKIKTSLMFDLAFDEVEGELVANTINRSVIRDILNRSRKFDFKVSVGSDGPSGIAQKSA